jgi:hypothetical protein
VNAISKEISLAPALPSPNCNPRTTSDNPGFDRLWFGFCLHLRTTLASMDLSPPPYSERRHFAKEGISWNWAKIDKYITAERITPKVFFALQITVALHSRHYGRARRQHGAQNLDLTPFQNGLWWARTSSIVLSIFTESASPLPDVGSLSHGW